jgi:hypothetical protein
VIDQWYPDDGEKEFCVARATYILPSTYIELTEIKFVSLPIPGSLNTHFLALAEKQSFHVGFAEGMERSRRARKHD